MFVFLNLKTLNRCEENQAEMFQKKKEYDEATKVCILYRNKENG